jgi:hypothetical protein
VHRRFHRSAVKQLEAQLLFSRLDAAAESRLGQMAQQGGAAKVACIGQGHQVFETFEVHCAVFRRKHVFNALILRQICIGRITTRISTITPHKN